MNHCRPDLLHPYASAIDSPELKAPEQLVERPLHLVKLQGADTFSRWLQ